MAAGYEGDALADAEALYDMAARWVCNQMAALCDSGECSRWSR